MIDTLMIPPNRFDITAFSFRETSFLGALYASGLAPDIFFTPDITILIPNDAALRLVSTSLKALSPEALIRTLKYHIIPGIVGSPKFTNGSQFDTVTGPKLTVTTTGNNQVFVNSAKFLAQDILVGNGMVHIIDAVLNPDASNKAADPTATSQAPAFPAVTDPALTASNAPLPFTAALPCTTDGCPKTGGPAMTGTGAVNSRTSAGLGVAAARCTGVAGMGVAALGVVAALV